MFEVKAIQITGPRRAEIIEVDMPKLTPGDVRVKLQKTCLCGSDIPFFAYDQQALADQGKLNFSGHIDYSNESVYPLAPGLSLHECVGVVTESKSEKLREGDFVLALPFHQSGFFEYLTLPDSRIFKLPDSSLSKEEMLLCQPLGTLLYGFRMMPKLEGKTVAVVGQGPIGLLFNALLKRSGASTVIGVDRFRNRLDVGAALGADESICLEDGPSVDVMSKLTNGAMADIVIEAVGHGELALDTSIDLVRKEGTILAFGVVDTEYVDRFPLGKAFYKNLTIKNTVGAKDEGDFLAAADMIANREVDLKPLITHTLPFEEAQRAYELFVDREDGAIKVVIDFE
mgnify:FL=1|jgi:threonine dehydrogenase-like Zn-dependent dehydrogenase|tara:strand:- start:629 stop:1654 length:1026 start_codon:yes stop_codon:yes gene_type:complete